MVGRTERAPWNRLGTARWKENGGGARPRRRKMWITCGKLVDILWKSGKLGGKSRVLWKKLVEKWKKCEYFVENSALFGGKVLILWKT